MNTNESIRQNPLGTEPVGKLLRQFAIPSIIAMLVSALYNIVDQFFIGRSVGELGNAATNVAFPLSISCTALALLFGIGGAAAFNLAMGQGKKDEAIHYIGNAALMLFSCGLVLTLITQLFLTPMLILFGAPDNVLGYATTYTRITSLGFPFLIMATGGGHLIRADGSPRFTMICNMTGAIINTILDALFVFVFQWGMAGAALATIIGQYISGGMAIYYLFHYKTVPLKLKHLYPQPRAITKVVSLGGASFVNQISMMIVQITMNKSLSYYGALSVYGAAIPLACVGIVSKVGMLFFSFIIGISQGLQPIISFNYGARKYDRVKSSFLLACKIGGLISLISFIVFQIFPRNIIAVFGNGSEEYFQFGIRYFRIYFFFTFWNFLQPISSNFFSSIGKPTRGMFLSLTRQIIFLLPLILILPLFGGIDGIIYAGPIADFMAGVVAITMLVKEFRSPEFTSNHAHIH